MATLYSMVDETGNRNRILQICQFRMRFPLVHCGTITSVVEKFVDQSLKTAKILICTLLKSEMQFRFLTKTTRVEKRAKFGENPQRITNVIVP